MTNEEHHGWPGDGSGEDDLADYNQNEADDYRNEGEDDTVVDEWEYPDQSDYYPDETPLGQEYEGE